MTQAMKPELKRKISLTLGIFCAGTPSTRGTLDLLRSHSIDPETVGELRYRGMGWPGMATVRRRNEKEVCLKIPYKESWGFVQKYRPFRCYLCPDLTGEFADISLGDPWYREINEQESGQSLILIRTDRGRQIFHQALASGYIEAAQTTADVLYKSQKNLLKKRQAIWGRLLALKILGIHTPEIKGFHLFGNWLDLSLSEKIKSIGGTVRRIVQRNYFKPLDYSN
jgi:coenzyme F420 hydrogenase subunit beta